MRAEISSGADIGRLVQYIRHAHGLTQRELAARLGVSHRWYNELESGKGKQANERYFEVLERLGIRLYTEVDETGTANDAGAEHDV